MANSTRHIAVPSLLLSLLACSDASAAYVGDRYFISTLALDGPDAGESTGTINPGLIWVQEEFQFGPEAIIPINEDSGGLGMRAQFHWYFAKVFPNSFLGKSIFDN